MNKYYKVGLVFGVVMMFVSSTILPVSAEMEGAMNTTTTTTTTTTMNSNSPSNLTPLEQTGEVTRINWDMGTAGTIEAMGMGVPPKNSANNSYGHAMSRTAALVIAQRNLLATVKGMQIDSETSIEDSMVKSDTIKSNVSGMIKGARVVREASYSDGAYLVVMSINMYGENSLAEIAYNAVKPEKIEEFPQPSPEFQNSIVGTVSSTNYTGVIIDAGDLGLQTTFSPRVYDESGNIVYGNKYINPDFAIKHGMVEYLRSNEAAALPATKNTRAGANPLVVRAVKVIDNNYNIVISNEDAQKVLASHSQNGFLSKCAVVFAMQ